MSPVRIVCHLFPKKNDFFMYSVCDHTEFQVDIIFLDPCAQYLFDTEFQVDIIFLDPCAQYLFDTILFQVFRLRPHRLD